MRTFSMVEITILELNLDRADLTANAPGSLRGEDTGRDEKPASDGGGFPVGLALAAVGAVVIAAALGVVAKRLRGGDGEPSDDAPR